MRGLAKASSAGSSEGVGGSRGPIRRAFAIRGASLDVDGSGASSLGSGKIFSLRLFGLAALAATVLVVLVAAPASAAPTYQFAPAQTEKLATTLEEGTGATFQRPRGLTFDSTGNLYLADNHGHAGESIIDKFDSENAFTAQLGSGFLSGGFVNGVAVNDETGHIFAADSNFTEVFAMDAAGAGLSQWKGDATPSGSFGGGCCFIYTAVDNSTSTAHGDIYVLTNATGAHVNQVNVFASKNGDAEEGEYLRSLETPPGGFAFAEINGLAVDDSTGPTAGRVYVADPGNHAVDYFSPSGEFKGKVEGPSLTEHFGEPVDVAVDSASGDLFVVDRTARAVYRFSPSGELVARVADPDHLTEPLAVDVQTTGPRTGDLYVSNRGNELETVEVFEIQRPSPPIVEIVAATGVTAEAATLLAEINPRGEATEYRLEYGPCPTVQPCPLSPYQLAAQGTLGSSGDYNPHTVTAPRLTGLAPQTTYHYRVVATNTQGETIGEERTFTTQGAATLNLPDGRGYELVSPPDKHGGSIGPIGAGVIEAAADGSAISYIAFEPIEADPEGNGPGGSQILSTRGASGWASRGLANPYQRATGANLGLTPEYRFLAADLSAALIQPYGLLNPELSPEATEQSPYLRTLGSCDSFCYRPLLTAANALPGFGDELPCQEVTGRARTVCGAILLAATPDLSHAIFFSTAPLVEGAPQGGIDGNNFQIGSLYEWSRSTGAVQLISRLPENGAGEEPPAPPSTAPYGNLFGPIGNGRARRALSADGSRVFWNSAGNLYLRDTEAGHEQTLQVDLAEEACLQAGECESGGGVFQIASADGSRVFFTDSHRLTEDSGAVPSEGSPNSDLYECAVEEEPNGKLACALTDLTPKANGENEVVQSEVLGASEDGSYLYFAAGGVLASNEGADHTHAAPATCQGSEADSSATCNLYLVHDGALTFIATLSGGDRPVWETGPRTQPTRVSPDGNWLAFMSQQPLTGYDNRDAVSGTPDAEIYLYDAASGRLRCASCDPTGARPVGIEYNQLTAGNQSLATVPGQWRSGGWVAALPPAATNFLGIGDGGSAYQGRYLSNSGRLFFNALGGLVPADSNGIGDVYQFEQPQGPGQPASNSCTTGASTYVPASGGCLDLISSGTGKESSAFLDASESGDDVFFRTAQHLTPKDVDSANDIYDARSGGGEPEVVKPVECSGDACQQPAVPPNDATPGSLTFQGAGNVHETKAKKHTKRHKKKSHKKQAKKRANSNRGGGK